MLSLFIDLYSNVNNVNFPSWIIFNGKTIVLSTLNMHVWLFMARTPILLSPIMDLTLLVMNYPEPVVLWGSFANQALASGLAYNGWFGRRYKNHWLPTIGLLSLAVIRTTSSRQLWKYLRHLIDADHTRGIHKEIKYNVYLWPKGWHCGVTFDNKVKVKSHFCF